MVMSKWVGAEWGYCDLYLGGLFWAVWAWQGNAVVWPWLVLQTDRYGPRESAGKTDSGKLFYSSFTVAKHSFPSKLRGRGKSLGDFRLQKSDS